MKYISKIDGCRAFAVLAVLFSHYLPEGYITHDLPLGLWGVQLFFVLSGYLITKILLKSKEEAENNGSRIEQLRVFYIRRVLRIFPAYYALLIMYKVLGVHFEGASFWTCLTYVFNIHQSFSPNEYHYLGHLWTLCIEEQFYMIWPWLMLFLPRKSIVPVTMSLVLAAPLSRLILSGFDLPYISIRNLPTSQLDSLCGGALLAQFQMGYSSHLKKLWDSHSGKICVAGIVMTTCVVSFSLNSNVNALIALWGPALVSMFIVDHVSLGHYSKMTGFLDFAPLRYIGKISYGIYLYQFVSLFPLHKLMTLAGNPKWLSHDVIYALIWGTITILIASISWKVYEYPVCRLKRYFEYHK